jgi:hypothetical protein
LSSIEDKEGGTRRSSGGYARRHNQQAVAVMTLHKSHAPPGAQAIIVLRQQPEVAVTDVTDWSQDGACKKNL